jgi:RND family efflux transporter MFP subunit
MVSKFGARISRSAILPLATLSLLLTATGCELLPNGDEAKAQSQSQEQGGAPAVETAIASTGFLEDPIEYTGTTEPVRQVSLRSQAEGRLLNLEVDVGDPVRRGQVLGQLDNRLLLTLTNQARAELAARQSEVAQAEAQVNDAQAQVARIQAQLQQAQTDAARQQSLADEGVVSQQLAEQAQTSVQTLQQELRSAQEQVKTRRQAVVAAQGRVSAQQATVAEAQERKAYSSLTSPISGSVLERVLEPGNLVQPGEEVLKLGDFSSIKVVVKVSELELGSIRLGQTAQVRLDAFADRQFSGKVTQISPVADPTARLVPIEVEIPNPGDRIGSGLLARVQFQSAAAARVVIPERALAVAGPDNRSTLFVVQGEKDTAKAVARSVQLGDRANGQVEVRSGLKPGEAFVVRSSKPLTDSQLVRLSILSDSKEAAGSARPSPP